MWIRGPRLLYRPLRLSDAPTVIAALEDWPPDERGPMTIQRLQAATSKWANASRDFHAPCTPASRFLYAGCILAVGTDASAALTPVGVHVVDVGNPALGCSDGTQAVTTHQAFAIEHRGFGYFTEMQITLQRFAFEVMQLTEIRHRIMGTSAAALGHVERREKYVKGAPEDSQLIEGRRLFPGVLTREAWQAWALEHDELGQRFEFEL